MENKITKDQLDTIKKHQNRINSVLNEVGYLESKKHALLHDLSSINTEVESFKSELEKEYGHININVEDGTYTKVEEEVLEDA